jgi:hypothetical protein
MAKRTVDKAIREAELGHSADDLAHPAATDEAQLSVPPRRLPL